MAINYVVSYTFSPSTTISSSQVNTNFSDNASTWQGLEAKTKSFAALQVDATPTAAADVPRKDYVDKLNAYRRPVLQFGSVTTVAIEAGLDGTSGDIPLLFPDGTLRTETSTTRTTFNITRNAVLVTSGAQSGLTGATSEATNTWYALYGVKVTDSSTLWVTVGSTVLPLQANFSTLNTAYGASGWVFLGMIRNGDNSGATGDILAFKQTGNFTLFDNTCSGSSSNTTGLRLANTAGATSLTYSYSAGTGTTGIPNHFVQALYAGGINPGTASSSMADSTNTLVAFTSDGTHRLLIRTLMSAAGGVQLNNATSVAMDVWIAGWSDPVLGIGANPVL